MIVTLIAAVSADGKIGQDPGQSSLDWTSKEDTRFFVEKTKEIGTVVMGRKTFETIGKPLKGRRTVVISSGAGKAAGPAQEGEVEWTSESPAELVARLRAEGVAGLAVCGGATVYSQFLQAGLVNELYLTVEPVLFPDGISFVSGLDRVGLELVETTRLGNVSILLRYRVPQRLNDSVTQ